MNHHKITSEKDVIELQKYYEDDAIFELFSTGEEVTLSELRYNADWEVWQPDTIQHI